MVAFLLWLVLDGAFTAPARFWRSLIDRINSALYADTRREMQATSDGGFSSSALMGVVFAAGWTPCIGPVYGAILTLAANGGDVGQAGGLLAAYSLGLGIPFLITALALDSAQGILRRLQSHMHTIELVSGAFLVLIGVAVASGQLQSLSQQFSTGQFAEFAISVEENVIGAINGSEQNAEPTAAASPTPQESAGAASDLLIINPDTTAAQPRASLEEVENGPGAAAAGEDHPALSSIMALANQDKGRPSVGISKGNIAPDFETVSDTGQPIRLADYRGQVVLLNFWATWCGPCRLEMPEFQAAYDANKDAGFAVVAVNNAEPAASIQAFRQELGLSFPLAMDSQADIQVRYNIFSYPTTYLLNRDGIIIDRSYGPLTAEQIDDIVTRALAT